MSLTIEFAGISTLLWQQANGKDKGRDEATVVLVDLATAGFHSHHATLAMEGGVGVSCPEPDTSIAVPGSPSELGVWNLNGMEIELIADAEPLSVDDSEIDHSAPPAANSGSIRWLPEIGGLCQSRTLAPGVPTAARMQLKVGRITSTAAGHPPVRILFDDNDEQIGEERYVHPRFMVEVACAKAAIRLGRKHEFRFDSDHHLIISNTCVCEPPARTGAGHFYAHYLLVEAKRKPRVRRTSGEFRRPKGFSVPSAPEYCFCAYAAI